MSATSANSSPKAIPPQKSSRPSISYLKAIIELGNGVIEMTDNLNQLQVLNIKQTVERATACGINISEYTLRRAIRTKQVPCKIIGRTYLIPWDGFLRWVSCEV